ncbi:hypothetical protein N7495_009678 [Penicillium taxi]|uniref:uncharacterized protein n=1 Tax=Penicillium taxi TaxID=168475 RepID=UPI002544F2C8|nr:uncharacterized protein N7495_009678 [Penicillium taxi]KAJ5885168.1 hypothetical protein N7495_009678 [Penicillium taxi]
MSSKPQKVYISKGQTLDRPISLTFMNSLPISVRLTRFFESIYLCLGLYLVTLFSFDPYATAQRSRFNKYGSKPTPGRLNRGTGFFGGGGGGGTSGGGPPPPGSGRPIGRVDDIRGTCELTMKSPPTTNTEWKELISKLIERIPQNLDTPRIPQNIPQLIDHTLLSVPATPEQIDKLCAEAKENDFASVCVRLEHVARAASHLKNTPNTVVACVVGFHEGTQDTSIKVQEAESAVQYGASELDMVINWPLLKEGEYTKVYDDLIAVRSAAPAPVILKVILEISQLNRDQIIAGTIVAGTAGADFVKTSTGFCGGGATVDSVSLMSRIVESCFAGCRVKASGGVRSAVDCLSMAKAGATRIGTSSGIKIAEEVSKVELLGQLARSEAPSESSGQAY